MGLTQPGDLELAREIRASTFAPARLRMGYDMAQVDALLEQAAAALECGEPVADLVERSRFTPRRRHAYDVDQVDTFLEHVVRAAGAGEPPQPRDAGQVAAEQARIIYDAVVTEQHSWWSRRRSRG